MAVPVKKDDLNSKLKRFKFKVAKEGTLSKARERAQGYKKPGVVRSEEKKKNTINSRRNNRKNNI